MAFELADLIAPALNFLGGERANDTRERIAQQANEFSAQQYATRYQTTVKDLTAAGLNPMLAYSQGAGSAPSGQQAQGIENTMSSAVEGYQKASQAQLMKQQILQSKEQITNTQADTLLKQANTVAAEAQAKLTSAQASKAEMEEGLLGAQKMETLSRAIRTGGKMGAETQSQEALAKVYFSQVAVNKATLPRLASEVVLNGANASLAKARIAEAVANGQIAQADVNRALNDARYERSTGGVIRQTTRDIGNITGAAANAKRAGMR